MKQDLESMKQTIQDQAGMQTQLEDRLQSMEEAALTKDGSCRECLIF